MTTDRPSASEITDDQLDRLYAELDALRTAPVLRTCLLPGCLMQVDVAAHLAGRAPARPEWAADGWRLFTGRLLPGPDYACPTHVGTVAAHTVHWTQDAVHGLVSVCACGWQSTGRRWHGAARALWEEHLLAVLGAEVIGE